VHARPVNLAPSVPASYIVPSAPPPPTVHQSTEVSGPQAHASQALHGYVDTTMVPSAPPPHELGMSVTPAPVQMPIVLPIAGTHHSPSSGNKEMLAGACLGGVIHGCSGCLFGGFFGLLYHRHYNRNKGVFNMPKTDGVLTPCLAPGADSIVPVKLWRAGETAPLTVDGLHLVMSDNRPQQLEIFCTRVVYLLGGKVTDYNKFRMEFVARCRGKDTTRYTILGCGAQSGGAPFTCLAEAASVLARNPRAFGVQAGTHKGGGGRLRAFPGQMQITDTTELRF